MARFDQSRLTPAAREWLADYYDLPAVTVDIPRDDWCDMLLSDRITMAARYAEAGWTDDRIEQNLRDRQEREEVRLRLHPTWHVGQHDFFAELVTQALEAVAAARRQAMKTVSGPTAAELKAIEAQKKEREARTLMSSLLGVA
jgi:hypothetical protein